MSPDSISIAANIMIFQSSITAITSPIFGKQFHHLVISLRRDLK